MKTRKLILNTEVLRSLSDAQRRQVVGGTETGESLCDTYCDTNTAPCCNTGFCPGNDTYTACQFGGCETSIESACCG
jgi:hypothetical protein